MSIIELKPAQESALQRLKQQANLDRRAASDMYSLLHDEAARNDLYLVAGVYANGETFSGAFAEERARYQITASESGTITRSRDFVTMDNFDRFSPEGKKVEAFFAKYRTSFIEYDKLDRIARESTRIAVTSAITGN